MDYRIHIKTDHESGDLSLAMWHNDELVETVNSPAINKEKVISKIDALVKSSKRSSYGFETIDVGELKVFRSDNPKNIMSAAYVYGRRHHKRFRCWALSNGSTRVRRIS